MLFRYCLPAVAISLIGTLSSPAAFSDSDEREARIAGSGWVADAPTKVADALGYFNPAGTEPRIRVDYYNSGKEALERLLQGDAEFALAATTPVAIAMLEQTAGEIPEIVILASIALSNQSHYLIASRDRGITAPLDLTGRRIGLMRDTSGHFGWSRFAIYHRIGDDRVTLVDVPIDRQAEALAAGEVDAVVTWDPWGERIHRTLGERTIRFSTRQVYTVNWLLITRRELVRQYPELADRVVAGYRQAIEFIDRDPEQARTLHARIGGVDSESLATLERGIIWKLGLNWSVLANMEAQFEWLGTRPEHAGILPPAPRHYLDTGPLGRVAPERLMLPPYLYRLD